MNAPQSNLSETSAATCESPADSNSDRAARAEQRRQELRRDLEEMRDERATKQRRKMYRESRLNRFSKDLILLRECGASYPEMTLWLKRNKNITVAHTTVMRYLAGLSEFRKRITAGKE